ncbi:MAG: division/cell wall cluster transcriptional repressor MraZ [Myxococcales bacterium]|nr:division/cell wall cluster transcriptional repressor MraZ [Myxococcales bacterium]MDH5306626.1 division/cell wall cluster transcriptional repressor MraZ [Myxococcales bacterium]MDH5567248.1 division/cell wall cluster transcriptional repressor MraZ [Myxococcales bacterium]
MFRGRFVHTIDTKNRMSLPAGFRQELQRRSDQPPILTNAHECLDLFPFEDWLEFEERIVGIASVDPEAQAYARMMISGATPCPIDKQGRILVPPHLRDHAGLDREVTVAGVGPKIELWDKARFEANLTQTNARYPEMARSVAAKLGP